MIARLRALWARMGTKAMDEAARRYAGCGFADLGWVDQERLTRLVRLRNAFGLLAIAACASVFPVMFVTPSDASAVCAGILVAALALTISSVGVHYRILKGGK